MTVAIPEVASAVEAGAADAGTTATGAIGEGANATTKVWRNPAAAPTTKVPAARQAPSSRSTRPAPKAKAPITPTKLRTPHTSKTYGPRAGKGSPYQSGKSSIRKGSAFFKPPNLLSGGGGGAHRLVIAEFALCVILIGADPVLTRKPASSHLYLANDFVRLTAVCGLFFILALMSNTEKMSKVAAAFGGLVTLGILYNATPALAAFGSIFTSSTAANKAGQAVAGAAAGVASVDRASYTPTDLTADPSAGASRGKNTATAADTGTGNSTGEIAV